MVTQFYYIDTKPMKLHNLELFTLTYDYKSGMKNTVVLPLLEDILHALADTLEYMDATGVMPSPDDVREAVEQHDGYEQLLPDGTDIFIQKVSMENVYSIREHIGDLQEDPAIIQLELTVSEIEDIRSGEKVSVEGGDITIDVTRNDTKPETL